MEDRYLVSTPENIELSYVPAGMGTRFLAALIDSIILSFLLLFVLIGGLILAAAGAGFGDAAGALVLAGLVILAFVVFFGYYIFFETVWKGQSPGKRLLGLRAMRDDGLPLNFTASVIRNLIRLFDFLPGAYGFGVVAMFFNKRWKRLGDMAAGTIVILDSRPEAPRQLYLPVPPDPSSQPYPMRARLAPGEYELVREYLLRYYTLSPAARDRVGHSLSVLTEERTGLPRGVSDPARYLSTVMALHSQG